MLFVRPVVVYLCASSSLGLVYDGMWRGLPNETLSDIPTEGKKEKKNSFWQTTRPQIDAPLTQSFSLIPHKKPGRKDGVPNGDESTLGIRRSVRERITFVTTVYKVAQKIFVENWIFGIEVVSEELYR